MLSASMKQRCANLKGMNCPFCHFKDTKVIDSRAGEDGLSIRRRRECPRCHRRFTTVETTQLLVQKRNGELEPFSRQKIIEGVSKACQTRPITHDQLKDLGREVEEDIRSRGVVEIPSSEIGKAILKPLRKLDLVAYMRFASVYQNFKSLDDFERAIQELRATEQNHDSKSESPADAPSDAPAQSA
jgi:transcriptional repressor NrdR